VSRLKKGLKVKVVVGKDKGKEGLIKALFLSKNKVVVEGINIYKKHVKPTNGTPGEILDIERPIDVSNVLVVDSEKKKKK